MASQFEQLGLQPWLANQCRYMEMHKPTAIQTQCIPAILAGKHVVGGAATGSGKTAAFALPILQLLAADVYGVFALVVTPSRELAYQIVDQFVALGAPLHVRTMLAIGGVPHEQQVDAIKARPHVVVGTPGRLCHLFDVFKQETARAVGHLRFLILDEADRLTEGDMERDVRRLVTELLPSHPKRQVLLFTATLHPRLTSIESRPTAAPLGERVADEEGGEGSPSYLPLLGITDPSTVVVAASEGEGEAPTMAAASVGGEKEGVASATPAKIVFPAALSQSYMFLPNIVKLPYLVAALRGQGKAQLTMVFVNSCLRAELVRLSLQLLGFPVCSLDSLLTQQHRLDNVASFKLGISRIMVSTDIAARGLDIPAVNLVIHYDIPKEHTTYVHRVGRTARAGRPGTSLAFITEYDVQLVHKIEKKTKTKWALFPAAKETEAAVLPLLDEVSTAKIQAKQQVEEQYGRRAATRSAGAAEKKLQRAAAFDERERTEAIRRAANAKKREVISTKRSRSPPEEAEVARPKSLSRTEKPLRTAAKKTASLAASGVPKKSEASSTKSRRAKKISF